MIPATVATLRGPALSIHSPPITVPTPIKKTLTVKAKRYLCKRPVLRIDERLDEHTPGVNRPQANLHHHSRGRNSPTIRRSVGNHVPFSFAGFDLVSLNRELNLWLSCRSASSPDPGIAAKERTGEKARCRYITTGGRRTPHEANQQSPRPGHRSGNSKHHGRTSMVKRRIRRRTVNLKPRSQQGLDTGRRKAKNLRNRIKETCQFQDARCSSQSGR